MNNFYSVLLTYLLLFSGCKSGTNTSPLTFKWLVQKDLKEISGITAAGNDLWVITDKPHAEMYKLNEEGNIGEKVTVTNTKAIDIEAITSDSNYLYLADVGDNNGDRSDRKIIKVKRTDIAQGREVSVTGEVIEFVFPDEGEVVSKKNNNYDCEAVISYKDSLFVFTKDREDKETRLYALPKIAGKYTARFINSYDAKGLITDAAINPANGELALIGYHKNHLFPFIILFDGYLGFDFFSGKDERIELADKPWDWQLEGITYAPNNMVVFLCEGSQQVKATVYGIKRDRLGQLDKSGGNVKSGQAAIEEPGAGKKDKKKKKDKEDKKNE